MANVSVTLQRAHVDDLPEIVQVVRSWQHDGAPVQLHPGDLGWHWRLGAQSVAERIRLWRRNGDVQAAGFLDGAGLVRMGIAPPADGDGDLAARIVDDLSDPAQQVLAAGEATVEARAGGALRARLAERGWMDDDPWVPLRRDLGEPVDAVDRGLRVEMVGAESAADWLEVVRVSFGSAPPPPDRWSNLAGSPMLQDQHGRLLVGYDRQQRAVAAVAVWSAGPGRPGLVEPMGVHDEHRGRGHGRAITLAAATALRTMGSSSAVVATPAVRAPAVATYVSAGFRTSGPVTDFRRPG